MLQSTMLMAKRSRLLVPTTSSVNLLRLQVLLKRRSPIYSAGRCLSSSSVSILSEDAEDIIRQIPLADCRNFLFFAHVDHGKSSLSSRLLELTGNLGSEAQKVAQQAVRGEAIDEKTATTASEKEQHELLDTLAVEQQRGITVKASAATMLYPHPSAIGPTGMLLLNMTDTPGKTK